MTSLPERTLTTTWRQNLLPGVPSIESPFFETLFAEETSSEFTRIARSLHEDGYAIIKFPEAEFDARVDRIIKDLNDRYDWDSRENVKSSGLRIQDAWRFQKDVRHLAANSTILELLSKLYGRRAFPFQTINFPVGTEQHFHTDSIHFASNPERFMCGVWVAFEDVDESNGPLEYYPKSHKLPIYLNEALDCMPGWREGNPYNNYQRFCELWRHLVEVYQLERQEFHPRKGEAIIWAANLLHGGALQKDPTRTRHSQVTHYFFENCAYYTPLMSVPFVGAITYRNNLLNIATEKPVEHSVGSLKVPSNFVWEAIEAGKFFAEEQLALRQSLWTELQQTRMELQHSLQVIEAMKSSKFWKIRQVWTQLKSIVGLTSE